MTDRELLEHILYELRLANWYTRGRKGEPPTPPEVPDETTVRTFSGRVVNTYNINAVDTDEAFKQLRRQDGSGAA